MQSSSAKATTGHFKCTEGMFVKEAHRFKAGKDLDDLCARLETHFKKHRMDTITCRNNPNKVSKVASVFDSCPLFTIKSMKAHNAEASPECDTHDKQNNGNAIKCFMKSLGEDLR